jgi:hypothetical protein
MTDPIHRLLADLRDVDDDVVRLELVTRARAELEALDGSLGVIRSAEIDRARTAGLTWRQIGDALGVSLQRAHELGNLSPTPTTERTRT